MTTWICELNKEDVKLIAALTHAYLKEVPDQIIANKLISKLREQTEGVVSLNPEDHKLTTIPDRPEPAFKPVLSPMLYMPGDLLDE